MDKLEFKKLVRDCLIQHGFLWHAKGKCYLCNMGDYTLKVTLQKSYYSPLYYLNMGIFVNACHEESDIVFSKNPDMTLRITYIENGICKQFELDTYSDKELKNMLYSATKYELQRIIENGGMKWLVKEYECLLTMPNKEYILKHYS